MTEKDLENVISEWYYGVALSELHLMNEKFEEPNITYNSLLYLDIISYRKECTATFIAESLNVTNAAVTAKVNELIAQGLVEKTQSERDRRVNYLKLTKKAAKLFEIYDVGTKKGVKKVAQVYGKDEIETFARILKTFSAEYLGHTYE